MALRNGSRFGVSMQDVFAHGCHLMPDSITEAHGLRREDQAAHPGGRQADRQAGVAVPGSRTWTRSWRAGPARRS